MKLAVSEILEKANTLKTKKERIDYLRSNDNVALRGIIQLALDPKFIWSLPVGAPPYKPFRGVDNEGVLYSEMRRLYIFLEGGHPTLKQMRREQLFIQLLESVTPKDAEMLIAVKDKKLPYKGITRDVIHEAFPGLLTNG